MPIAPFIRRRWFQFGFGTIFVLVTGVACWLGYTVPWMRQRQVFLAQAHVICELNDSPPSTLNRWGNTWPVFAPRGMWLLGERGVVNVWLPPKVWSRERQAEAARLFPEALLLKVNSHGNWVSQGEPTFAD